MIQLEKKKVRLHRKQFIPEPISLAYSVPFNICVSVM